jgi:serine/threonine protein kinase
MAVAKCADAEPLRGYRLVERLGAGGFGEVWKCEAPGGIFKAVKFVYGSVNGLSNDSVYAEDELRAFQLIKSIRHPFLLSIDRVEVVDDELVIVTELADENLHERLEKCRAYGHPGLPREELFGYLRETAEVLDLLHQKFNLQHLDVKPRNLFLVSNHVKVADFGLVNSLSDSVTTKLNRALNAVTPLYAAPELFVGHISRHCDQYSLAIAYQELLTGTLPFAGKNYRQLLMQHTQGEPDLHTLPAHDRAMVARALAKDPEQRFHSCMEFVQALQASAGVPGLPTSREDGMGETVVARSGDTATLSIAAKPVLPAGVLSEHRFVGRLSNSPLMEVWKTQLPDGGKKRVQMLFGLGSLSKSQLTEALTRLQSIQHPALLAPTVAHVEPGRLLLVTDPVRDTLRTRAQQCQTRKLPGVPRGELIEYLRAAAEVLDYLYLQHSVQHLQLNPRSLVLDNGWLQLDEFGYAHVLWTPAGQDITQRNARYAAPELASEVLSRHCDQYSLALIYAEMLTGVHPFRGLGPDTYMPRRLEPDLEGLPELDREVIRKALHPDPQQRWSDCTEMLLALEGMSPDQSSKRSDSFAQMVATARDEPMPAIDTGVDPALFEEVLVRLFQSAGGAWEASALAMPQLRGTGDALSCRVTAGLPLGAAQEQLLVFAKAMGGTIVKQTASSCSMHFPLPQNSWRKWWGQAPQLMLHVDLARIKPMSATPIDVRMQLATLHCSTKQTAHWLTTTGVAVVQELQQHMLTNSEKRARDRLLWPHPIRIVPLNADGTKADAIGCRGKDLSLTGMGLYLPHELPTSEVLIELPNPPNGVVQMPAKLVHVQRNADGWYEVGAQFRLRVHAPETVAI